jgi:hypothetical protein
MRRSTIASASESRRRSGEATGGGSRDGGGGDGGEGDGGEGDDGEGDGEGPDAVPDELPMTSLDGETAPPRAPRSDGNEDVGGGGESATTRAAQVANARARFSILPALTRTSEVRGVPRR